MMADNNTTGIVPAETTQQRHGAVVPAVNSMSGSEDQNNDNPIPTVELLPTNDEPKRADDSIDEDEESEALKEDEEEMENDLQFEREPGENDQMDDDTMSFSSYYESLSDDEEAIEIFKQKIKALGTELHVDVEEISYIREHGGLRAFPLTMRNPPERATLPGETRAVLRLHGWWYLNDRSSHGSDSEDDNESSSHEPAASEILDNADEADVPIPSSSNHVSFSDEGVNGGNEDVTSLQESQHENDEVESAPASQSPVSATSGTSASSNLSGTTLLNEDYDSDFDSDDDYDDMDDQWERLDEALLSNLLEDHGIPAPKTLAFDISWHNALKRLYSVQTYLPGDQVSKLYREKNERSLEDRFWLAGETAELRARLETVQFQGTGRLQANVDEDMSAGRLPLHMSVTADINEKLDTFDFLINPEDPESGRFSACGRLYYSLYDAMFWAVDDLMAKAMAKRQANFEPSFRAYTAIKDILRDMDHLGWFSEADKAYSRSVLNHGSINDRQILIERTDNPSKPWRLTGIIGFDQAESLPSILTRKPWSFLWSAYDAPHLMPEETRFSYNHDFDELPMELPYLSDDDLKVKQHHEEVFIEKLYTPQYGDKAREEYFDDTYGRGRWLRRLFGFAREGVPFPGEAHRFNKLLRDWNHFKRSQSIQPRPLNLWEGLPDYIHG